MIRTFFILSFMVLASCCDDNSTLYRLPKSVYPVSYDIELLTNVTRGNFSYDGRVEIELRVVEETTKIVLHADKLKILKNRTALRRIEADGSTQHVRIGDQRYDNETQFWIIEVSESLKTGRHSLSLRFVGELHDDLFGFYRSSYRVNNVTRWIGVTQFSPTFARRAFPCMDEPGFKAIFQLHLGHYDNETVSSNALPVSRNFTSKNYLITTFASTPRMSTYLVGWSVHDFKVRTNSSDPRITLWSRLGDQTSSILIQEGPKIYSALETWMNLPNPVKKIEQVAVPDFNFNAMENWGFITYRESIAEADLPTETEHRILTTMSHEYAHTWFGNLVTPDFWNHAWLKEGFATYFSHLSMGLVHPDWRIMDLFSIEVMQGSLLSDSDKHFRTMNGKNVGSPQSVKATLDFVTYDKGASIIRMISDVVGEDVFQKALRMYLRDRQFEAATPQDLYRHLDLALKSSNRSLDLPKSIDQLVETWANQPNYPLINVSRVSPQILRISQRPFTLNASLLESKDFNYSWWVPLEIMTPANGTNDDPFHISSTWLKPNETKLVELPGTEDPGRWSSWYLLNPKNIGYYRVNYDPDNWKALRKILNSDNYKLLPRVSRAALIDNAFNLARSGLVNYHLPLSLAEYLHREEDYEPWITANWGLSQLHVALRDKKEVQLAFRRYASDLINPIYTQLKSTECASDSCIKKMHRNLILSMACSLNLEDCVSRAKLIFDDWIDGENKSVPVNSKSFIYRTGIINGTDSDWLKLWNKFLKTDSHHEKILIFAALARTENSTFVDKLIEFSIQPNSDLAKQYRLSFVNSIVSSSKNIEHVLDYIEKNLKKIIDLQGINFLKGIFSTIGYEITSVVQKNKLLAFMKENSEELKMLEGSIHNAIKSAVRNIEWIDRVEIEVQKYLNKKL